MQVIRNLVTFDVPDGQVAAFGPIFRHETTRCVPREILIASLSLSSSVSWVKEGRERVKAGWGTHSAATLGKEDHSSLTPHRRFYNPVCPAMQQRG